MSTENRSDNSKRTVLVVDDEEINREILGGILCDYYNVLYAGNGEEAYDILVKNRKVLSLILLDLVMPVMNGFDFLEKIMSDPKLRKTPVIVLTSDRSAEVRSLNMGAMDFITKPYDLPDVILARVKRTVDLFENRTHTVSSERDGLTGLYTKSSARALTDTLLSEGGHGYFFIIDLDNFKGVNDTYGHLYGDEVLVKVAECIRKNTTRIDIAARFGGDEFTVFYPDMSLEEARTTAESFFRSLSESFKNERTQMTCSVGISFCKVHTDYNTMFEDADKALYESKKMGKNRFTIKEFD